MRRVRFAIPVTDAKRDVILDTALRLGLAVVRVTPTGFEVECPTDEDVYRFGCESGSALRDSGVVS